MVETQTVRDLSQAIDSATLILVDPKSNHNKTWCAWILPNNEVYVEWGRVGYKSQRCSHQFNNSYSARRKFEALLIEKRAKGYRTAEVEKTLKPQLNWDAADPVLKATFQAIRSEAANVEQDSLITFDPHRGVFLTSLGAISKTTIASAKVALKQVRQSLKTGNTQRFITAVGQYLSLIPLQVGMKLVPEKILGQPDQIKRQFKLLATLEHCLDQIDNIRGAVQQAIAEKAAWVWSDRSFWVEWGFVAEEEPVTARVGLLDDRSLYVAWE